jgi:ribonuclease HI
MEFNKIIADKYTSFEKVYTDGSKYNDKMGYAIVTPEKTTTTNIWGHASVYTAEIRTIKTAISTTPENGKKKHILTDSLSALSAILYKKTPTEIEAQKIANELHQKRDNVVLMWIPGHKNIKGNERADKAAKEALHVLRDNSEYENPIDVRRRIDYLLRPENTLRNTLNNRREQVVMSRVRMGYSKLTHSHLIEKRNPPICECSTTDDANIKTIEHIMWECPVLALQRESFKISRASLTKSQNNIIEFLKHANIYDEI